jgi:hypothetical protein
MSVMTWQYTAAINESLAAARHIPTMPRVAENGNPSLREIPSEFTADARLPQ